MQPVKHSASSAIAHQLTSVLPMRVRQIDLSSRYGWYTSAPLQAHCTASFASPSLGCHAALTGLPAELTALVSRRVARCAREMPQRRPEES